MCARSFWLAFSVFVTCLSATVSAQPGATDGEWRFYAADTYASKYSPLDQITDDNFADLEVAWRWETADTHLVYEGPHGATVVSADTLFEMLEADDALDVHGAVAAATAARAHGARAAARAQVHARAAAASRQNSPAV